MKVIFLNCWFAQVGQPFFDFIKQNVAGADIFCLSEVHPELFSQLQKKLPNFAGFYEQGLYGGGMGFIYGQAIFVRKVIKAENLGRLELYRNVPIDMGFGWPFKLENKGQVFYLMNVHGKSLPGTKLDTSVRLRQSRKIINCFAGLTGPKIIGGDFNLLPDTRSVELFEQASYRDLIKQFKIKNTRTRLAWERYPEEKKQFFADYVFVSPEVKVKDFQVPDIEISDHLPLILDFEV